MDGCRILINVGASNQWLTLFVVLCAIEPYALIEEAPRSPYTTWLTILEAVALMVAAGPSADPPPSWGWRHLAYIVCHIALRVTQRVLGRLLSLDGPQGLEGIEFDDVFGYVQAPAGRYCPSAPATAVACTYPKDVVEVVILESLGAVQGEEAAEGALRVPSVRWQTV